MLAQIEQRFDGPLAIERTRYGDDVIVLTVTGELDLATTPVVREILEPAMNEPCAMVVVDLTELEFIGTKGIGLLYELARAYPDTDSLRLLPSRHPGVNKVLELTGVPTVIPMTSRVGDAG
jgi:anti-sigma B factor antagonist